LGREVRWFIHRNSDQHGHQQGVEGGQLDKADHHAETLLQCLQSLTGISHVVIIFEIDQSDSSWAELDQ